MEYLQEQNSFEKETKSGFIRDLKDLVEYIRMLDVDRFSKDFNYSELVFRGVKNSDYKLISSLGRFLLDNNISDNEWRRKEVSMMEEFKRKAFSFAPNAPSTDIDWLVLAQHFSLPTRLLDWSTSPLVAAYFATLDAEEVLTAAKPSTITDSLLVTAPKECAIYILNTRGLSETNDTITLDPSIVRPKLTDPRITAQQSIFTLSSHPTKSLEQEIKLLNREQNLKKVILSKQSVIQIHKDLISIGFGHFSIFPDLTGLAKEVKYRTSRKWLNF